MTPEEEGQAALCYCLPITPKQTQLFKHKKMNMENKMKNSEDIKMNIAGKFANNLYGNATELMDDLNKLCKQVAKEKLELCLKLQTW